MASQPPIQANMPQRDLYFQQLQTVPIKLGEINWKRLISHEPEILLVNRYFEENPTNQVDQVALLTRPALMTRTKIGTGPIRAMYQQDGCFGNNAFVVSGTALYRVKKIPGLADQPTLIPGTIDKGAPVMIATQGAGLNPYLFICDGLLLQVYDPTVDGNLHQVVTPDDVPITSLAYIGGFVICLVGNSQRFYWIRPGTKIIDPLDFAEAEQFPDWLCQALSLGDQFGLFGKTTTEFWYLTGDALAPFQRLQGRMYDQGIWDGTALKVGDAVLLVGSDGIVYSVEGGPTRISYYGLEEQIRLAMKTQQAQFSQEGL